MEAIDKKKFIFGTLFILANKLQTIGDQYLGVDDMTTRQWFLTVMIDQYGDYAPTLTEVAALMSSSHQNVKQLALKLEKKGFVSIEKDAKDGRILRLHITPKCKAFWENRENKDNQFLGTMFQDIGNDELDVLYDAFNKMIERVFKIGKDY